MVQPLTEAVLAALAPWRSAPVWWLGFSGGLDSSVLLHILATLSREQALPELRAVHIQHGLQPAAHDWPDHCEGICAALGVPLQVLEVQVVAQGDGLEGAARKARYEAWRQLLAPGELLLSAQHRNDQAETVMFRLLRGAGVQGLAAMAVNRALGKGQLVRPLLTQSRQQLECYAQAQALTWIEDPSNRDLHFSRNYLRHEVLPRLAQRWPRLDERLARTAEHLREAGQLLADLAVEDLARLQEGVRPFPLAWIPLPRLPLARLAELSEARQRNVLRHWLRPWSALPDTRHWVSWQQLRDAAPDASPCWELAGGCLQRAGGWLWWVPNTWTASPPRGTMLRITPNQPLSLPENGQVYLERSAGLPTGLQVAYRQGGERLLLPGRGHRDLKRLLQEAGVPAFLRSRLPLLFAGEQLLAVANLPTLAVQPLQFHWEPPGLS